MANKLMTPEEFSREVRESGEKHGIWKLLNEASEKDRNLALHELSNFFGGGFPARDDQNPVSP